MTRAGKWDFAKHEYRPYGIPDGWYCPLVLYDMGTIVNCASCGKDLPFGDTYTSRQIHNPFGFGYMVCEACMTKERMDESKAQKENAT